MNKARLLRILAIYEVTLHERGVHEKSHALGTLHTHPERALGHCLHMIKETKDLLQGDEPGGVERGLISLGFIQGILWSNNIYTIIELAGHGKPA